MDKDVQSSVKLLFRFSMLVKFDSRHMGKRKIPIPLFTYRILQLVALYNLQHICYLHFCTFGTKQFIFVALSINMKYLNNCDAECGSHNDT